MTAVERAATLSVSRACGFGALAIVCFMTGLSFEPPLAARTGGLLTLIMTLVLLIKGFAAERAPYRRTETWLILADADRPPPAVAQAVIGAALKQVFLDYARYAAFAAALLLLSAFILAVALR